MKKYLLTFALLSSVVALNAQQSKKDSLRNTYRQEFLLNPLSFFVGGFEIGYGFTTEKTNTKFIAGYYYSENAGYYDGGSDMEGFRAEVQRLYMKPTKGGTRFYAGGYVVYKSISLERTNNLAPNSVSASALGLGLIIGTRTYASDNFFFDLFVGGGPNLSLSGSDVETDAVHLPVVNPYRRGITPRAGLTLGIAF